MSATVVPILPEDLPRAAQFLHNYQNSAISYENWVSCFYSGWCPDQPNHGYMLLDRDRVVGTLGAIYSDQLIQGKTQRFCNLTSWCVLPDYRSHSTRLAVALLNQKDCHFTNLTPLPVVEKTLTFLKFKRLDDRHVIVPVLPYALTVSAGTPVYREAEAILRFAPPDVKKVYLDHQWVSGLYHLLIGGSADASLYLAYRKIRVKRMKAVLIMHASDPELFSRRLGSVCRELWMRSGALALRSDSRFLAKRPRISVEQPFRVPTLYRSDTLTPAQVGNLYSELVTLQHV